jgi:hypothetical protein
MLTLRSDDKELPISDGPWSSPDHRYLAYLGDGSLTVVDTDDGSEATLPTGPTDYLSLVSFVGDEVYLVHANDDALLRWRIGAPTAVAMHGVMRATAVSADGELIADMREIDDLSASSCTRVMSAADGDVLWETCKHRIEGFSPDGAMSGEAPPTETEPATPTRSSSTPARVTRSCASTVPDDADRQLSIVSGRFESDTTLLLSTEQAGEAASCAATSPPAPASVRPSLQASGVRTRAGHRTGCSTERREVDDRIHCSRRYCRGGPQPCSRSRASRCLRIKASIWRRSSRCICSACLVSGAEPP